MNVHKRPRDTEPFILCRPHQHQQQPQQHPMDMTSIQYPRSVFQQLQHHDDNNKKKKHTREEEPERNNEYYLPATKRIRVSPDDVSMSPGVVSVTSDNMNDTMMLEDSNSNVGQMGKKELGDEETATTTTTQTTMECWWKKKKPKKQIPHSSNCFAAEGMEGDNTNNKKLCFVCECVFVPKQLRLQEHAEYNACDGDSGMVRVGTAKKNVENVMPFNSLLSYFSPTTKKLCNTKKIKHENRIHDRDHYGCHHQSMKKNFPKPKPVPTLPSSSSSTAGTTCCSFCERAPCPKCTLECESCQKTFCKFCLTQDYFGSYCRTVCWDCFRAEEISRSNGTTDTTTDTNATQMLID